MHIPATGMDADAILTTLRSFKAHDMDWQAGRVFAYVYQPDDAAAALVKDAYMLYLTENCLDPTTFPSTAKLESDVVRMVADLLQGDEQVAGNVTSGGTESILLAVKTARDWARVHRPHIAQPEMVLPRTAHAAFHKAAHYLGVRPVIVDFDPVTFQADMRAMAAAITPNTITLVASAPSYSQGVIDPVGAIAALAQAHGLLCHVDACVGGIHLSFLRKLGHPVTPFDFSVPGVTSISVDMHKYGYAAKGASVVLYRDRSLRRHQIFASTDTTAYTIINPTALSSRSAGPLAGAWAILHYLGEVGYQEIVATVQAATARLIDGVNRIPGLRVLGQPAMSMFSFASETINVFVLADVLRRRGWYVQPQFSTPRSPRNLHISVTYGVAHNVEALLTDLAAGVEEVKAQPPFDRDFLQAAAAALAADPSPASIQGLMAAVGLQPGALPTETALINEVLDALPDEIANAVLIDFFNALG
ncbi:MAG TPA: aspartate aminotransferase family protein [Chloroflexi bacterium]|nr:aspartate aminotransferase family protein [Chloroflexota bacterium]